MSRIIIPKLTGISSIEIKKYGYSNESSSTDLKDEGLLNKLIEQEDSDKGTITSELEKYHIFDNVDDQDEKLIKVDGSIFSEVSKVDEDKTEKSKWKFDAEPLDFNDMAKPLSNINMTSGIYKPYLLDGQSTIGSNMGRKYGSSKHEGFDYSAAVGTPVKSIGDGIVVATGNLSGGGNTLIVLHEVEIDGKTKYYISVYMHMDEKGKRNGPFAVKPGDVIKKGQLIGYSGSTGNVTGPHLHLGLMEVNVDPQKIQNANTVNDILSIYGNNVGSWYNRRKKNTSINTYAAWT